MSKIAYLWGAGASYGLRDNDGNFLRGVPLINEFQKFCDEIIGRLSPLSNDKTFDSDDETISEENKILIKKNIEHLRDICRLYPTVDTYAKQLFVTHRPDPDFELADADSYEALKRTLTVFLMIVQKLHERDPRYDGFLASILDNKGHFHPVTILSWNYDLQFEQAYRGYMLDSPDLMQIWEKLNVFNKTQQTSYDSSKNHAVIKLNGTATFVDEQEEYALGKGMTVEPFFTEFRTWSLATFLNHLLRFSQYQNNLSYAWEVPSSEGDVVTQAQKRTNDTEVLIVIGYSFPYVNRDLDKEIIQSMSSLKRIVIQDPGAEKIKARVEQVLADYHVKRKRVVIDCVTDCEQFYLPDSF